MILIEDGLSREPTRRENLILMNSTCTCSEYLNMKFAVHHFPYSFKLMIMHIIYIEDVNDIIVNIMPNIDVKI